MVDAGSKAVTEYDQRQGFEPQGDAALRIFQAMWDKR
jgi:hypothetical protein